MRILEITTEHTGPFKTLIEVLKDTIPETNIEIRDEKKKVNNDNKNKTETKKKDVEISDSDKEEEEEENKDKDEDKDEDDDDNTETKEKITGDKKEDNSGIRIMDVNSTKTVLINVKLDAKNFTKFKCEKGKETLGINLGCLYKLIKTIDKDDILTLYKEHDDKNIIHIKFDNAVKKKNTDNKLKLLDLNDKPIKIPKISFNAIITMKCNEFHKLCREMIGLSEYVEIKCLPEKIIFSCKGEYAEKVTTYKAGTDGDDIGINHMASNKGNKSAPTIVQGIYELKDLILFGKCGSLCEDIEIYMKNNFPLIIKYTVGTLGHVLLCITPMDENIAKNSNYSDEDEYYSDEDYKDKVKK
jgi:proliferating cell nuclear antigen